MPWDIEDAASRGPQRLRSTGPDGTAGTRRDPATGSPPTSGDASRLLALRRVFVEWLLDGRHETTVRVPLAPPHGHGLTTGEPAVRHESWKIAELVYALWDDHMPVSNGVASLLGVDRTTTVSQVVRLLYVAHVRNGAATHGEIVEELALAPEQHTRELLDSITRDDATPMIR